MGAASKIQWCDDTFNGWIGCQKAGPGCDHCYAKAFDMRFDGAKHWGPGAPRRLTKDANWNLPIKWNREAASWDRPRLVFCGSRKDWADKAVPPEWRYRLWDRVRATPNLFWIMVSKRVGNIPDMLPDDWGAGYPNVCLVVTVCTQHEALRDVPRLLRIQAAVRGLSLEPLLGPIDVRPWLSGLDGLDWIILGGESGPYARNYFLGQAEAIVGQCADAGVACFHKQIGRRPVWPQTNGAVKIQHPKGGDPDEWPSTLRVRQFPPQFRHPQSIGRLTAAPPTAYLFGSER